MKNVHIWGYSGLHFPAFGLNTESYFVSLCIQLEYGKMRTRVTPNMDTFYAAKETQFVENKGKKEKIIPIKFSTF